MYFDITMRRITCQLHLPNLIKSMKQMIEAVKDRNYLTSSILIINSNLQQQYVSPMRNNESSSLIKN